MSITEQSVPVGADRPQYHCPQCGAVGSSETHRPGSACSATWADELDPATRASVAGMLLRHSRKFHEKALALPSTDPRKRGLVLCSAESIDLYLDATRPPAGAS